MTRLIYDSAETVVFDPVAANRNATRAALFNIGFRRIEAVATLDALAESIKRRPPDLAVCETQGVGGELCSLIQSLRQGGTSYNPFIVVVATAWEHNQSVVSQVLNSGADDLLLRPFSTTLLKQRIATHVERRKLFVITADYVGPDRRKDTHRPSNIDLFEPPNSLRMKAKDGMTTEEAAQKLDQELKVARDALNREKLRRDAFQVCVLWRLMQTQKDLGAFGVDLEKMKTVVRGISRRCTGTEFDPALTWCDSILAAIEGMEVGVDRGVSMPLLERAALSLNQFMAPEKTQADHLAAVDATVAIVKARILAVGAPVDRRSAAG